MVTGLVVGTIIASTAQAARPQAGDFALFYTGFADDDAFGARGFSGVAVDRPTYNIGWFVTERLMPYGGVAYQSRDDFSETVLRGGARFYGIPLGTSNVSTFVSGVRR
jgi:hypothetical protein